jgi:hypothetical protein
VFWSLIWLAFSVFGSILSLAWRGALLLGALFLIDSIAPGIVSCVFRETIGYEMTLLVLSQCTIPDVSHLFLISLAILLAMVLTLI